MRILVFSLLLLAVLTAGVTALLVKGFLETERTAQLEMPPEEESLPEKQTFVLVSEGELLPGDEISPADISLQLWPEDMLSNDFIVSESSNSDVTDEFMGAIARIKIPAGIPLRYDMVFKRSEAGILTGILSPGMRAVSVAIQPETGASGFILPGDYVDVIVTYDFETLDDEVRQAAETILEKVRVVAVDQELTGEDEEAIDAATITLEVTPKGAETISLGSSVGQIHLSLRSLSPATLQSEKTFTPDYEVFEALTIKKEAPPPPPLEEFTTNETVLSGGPESQIKVYRGVNESSSSLARP